MKRWFGVVAGGWLVLGCGATPPVVDGSQAASPPSAVDAPSGEAAVEQVAKGAGRVVERIDAAPYRGNWATFQAEVRFETEASRGEVWVRARGGAAADGSGEGADLGMVSCEPYGAAEWTSCKVDFWTPADAHSLEIGMFTHSFTAMSMRNHRVELRSSPPTAELPRSSADQSGIDPRRLTELLDRARAADSDAIVILKDGKVITEEFFGRMRSPIEAMSASKSITSLVVGWIIDQGKLSLDTPVWKVFPEWKQGKKESITVRHLLDHSSGIQAHRTTEEIYATTDFVQLALAAELSEPPGTLSRYNNKAVNLLSGIVERVTGKSMAEVAHEALFDPLAITSVRWESDGAGHTQGMSGLKIHPLDLAKLGQLVLQGGIWNGKRVLSESWIEESTRKRTSVPGSGGGLLWWLTAADQSFVIDEPLMTAWKLSGVSETFLEKVTPLKDRVMDREAFGEAIQKTFGTSGEWSQNTWKAGRPDATVVYGDTIATSARGYLGNVLIVVPKHHLVAVRMRRATGDSKRRNDPASSFDEFEPLVLGLVRSTL